MEKAFQPLPRLRQNKELPCVRSTKKPCAAIVLVWMSTVSDSVLPLEALRFRIKHFAGEYEFMSDF